MWALILGGVFLAASQACIFCRLPAHDLPGRLAQLETQWKEWVSPDFSAFALEIKGSFSSLPAYWQWLQMTKIPQYTREALCAPACRGSTILYNCSTCRGTEVSCWPRKRCLPGSHDLWQARILLFSVSGSFLLLGALSLLVENRKLQAKGNL